MLRVDSLLERMSEDGIGQTPRVPSRRDRHECVGTAHLFEDRWLHRSIVPSAPGGARVIPLTNAERIAGYFICPRSLRNHSSPHVHHLDLGCLCDAEHGMFERHGRHRRLRPGREESDCCTRVQAPIQRTVSPQILWRSYRSRILPSCPVETRLPNLP